jgi:hypothetical protein
MIRYMKPYLVAIGLLLFVSLAGARSAKAIPVTYSTAGSFNGGASTITFGAGGNLTTITFTGVSSTVDPAPNPFTFASLGQFQVSTAGSGATITPGTTFTLTITQTAPGAGTGSFPATLTGTIDQNTSTGLVTFTVSSVTINNVTYTLTNNPLPLVPPATNNGITTVQAQISTVPEPTTMLLLGTGLAGVAASVRKRRKGM